MVNSMRLIQLTGIYGEFLSHFRKQLNFSYMSAIWLITSPLRIFHINLEKEIAGDKMYWKYKRDTSETPMIQKESLSDDGSQRTTDKYEPRHRCSDPTDRPPANKNRNNALCYIKSSKASVAVATMWRRVFQGSSRSPSSS